MLTKLAPGATIDTATPQEVAAIIANELDARSTIDYTSRKGVINLDGTGSNGTNLESHNLGAQYDWKVERVSIAGAGAVGALVAFYENQVQDTDLLEVVQLGAAGMYTDSFSNDLHIPANSKLLVAVTGGVANGQVKYRLQIRLERRAQKRGA